MLLCTQSRWNKSIEREGRVENVFVVLVEAPPVQVPVSFKVQQIWVGH
jgi:hypothetical protein